MKLLLIALLIAINSYALDQSFVVEGYKHVPGMDYQIELLVQKPVEDHKVVLDCQSFINGLHYMNFEEQRWHDVWFLVMSGNDCEGASVFSREAIDRNEPFCVHVNLDNKAIDFFSDPSACNFYY